MAYWGNSDPTWLSLTGPQRVAAMAMLEAENTRGGPDVNSAKNVVGAIINRAEREKQSLEDHVSRKIYQPTIENDQRARLADIVKSPDFGRLTSLAEQRASGKIADWTGGADHFLAAPKVMLDLEAKDPNKYSSWRGWTGYDDKAGAYKNTVFKDDSHHFLQLLGKKDGAAPRPDIELPAAVASAQPASPTQSAPRAAGQAPNPTPAAAAPQPREETALLPFLASMLGSGAGTGAAAGATGGGFNLASLFGGGGEGGVKPNMGGLLGDLMGGKNPITGTPAPGTAPSSATPTMSPNDGSGGLKLAQGAMQAPGAAPLSPLARPQVNLAGLQAMLANRPQLGMRG